VGRDEHNKIALKSRQKTWEKCPTKARISKAGVYKSWPFGGAPRTYFSLKDGYLNRKIEGLG
jgi:hypothetical protein